MLAIIIERSAPSFGDASALATLPPEPSTMTGGAPAGLVVDGVSPHALSPRTVTMATRASRRERNMTVVLPLPRPPGSLVLHPCDDRHRDTVPRNLSAVDEERVDEVAGFERHQVIDRLAEPDELHGKAELGLDGEHDPALGGTVELGEHHTRHPHAIDPRGVTELAPLGEAVLPGGGIDDEQHL